MANKREKVEFISGDSIRRVFDAFKNPNSLSSSEMFMLLVLAMHTDAAQNYIYWPSQNTLHAKTHLSEKTIRAVCNELDEKKVITIIDRGKGHRSTRYLLNILKNSAGVEEDPLPERLTVEGENCHLRGGKIGTSEVVKLPPKQTNITDHSTTSEAMMSEKEKALEYLVGVALEKCGRTGDVTLAKDMRADGKGKRNDIIAKSIEDANMATATNPVGLMRSCFQKAPIQTEDLTVKTVQHSQLFDAAYAFAKVKDEVVG